MSARSNKTLNGVSTKAISTPDLQRLWEKGTYVDVSKLKPNPRNARTRSKRQTRQIADSINAFGFVVPIIVDENFVILAGHGRYAAAKMLDLKQVPAVIVDWLTPAKKRALTLADNKIPANTGWDQEILAAEIYELTTLLLEEGLDISITGFVHAEVDVLRTNMEEDSSDPSDDVDPQWLRSAIVTKPGDEWILGNHRLLCGDARLPQNLGRLMDGKQAAMAFLDPPYNVRVGGIVGRGKIKHREFAMASGEMSRAEFIAFLSDALRAAATVSQDGAVHYVCMDWRHIDELMDAADEVYAETLNIAVWVKSNAGQGSFYRSQHEFVGVFRVGNKQHLNNVELGRFGRNRSNVWHYAGVNSFRAGRLDELKSHPTVKPIALVADAMKDCTRPRDIVVDTFCGSGTTILAAERIGRRAYALEIEPRFVDISIRRWQAFTRKDAVHAATGRCFDELVADQSAVLRKRERSQ